MSKLLTTGGQGYDIVIPTDYAVSWLIKHNLLKKLDKSKLAFLTHYDQNSLAIIMTLIMIIPFHIFGVYTDLVLIKNILMVKHLKQPGLYYLTQI